MSNLGKRLIESLTEINETLAGNRSPEDMRVTPSCGCIFCDIGLQPTKLRRQYVHYLRKHGRFIICSVTGFQYDPARTL